jgi:hypothetical protein
MSYKTTRSIYYSFFQSRLLYGIIFWGAWDNFLGSSEREHKSLSDTKKSDTINSRSEQKNVL